MGMNLIDRVEHLRIKKKSFFFIKKLNSFSECVFSGDDDPRDYYLSDLCGQLSSVVAAKPGERINAQMGTNDCLKVIFSNV